MRCIRSSVFVTWPEPGGVRRTCSPPRRPGRSPISPYARGRPCCPPVAGFSTAIRVVARCGGWRPGYSPPGIRWPKAKRCADALESDQTDELLDEADSGRGPGRPPRRSGRRRQRRHRRGPGGRIRCRRHGGGRRCSRTARGGPGGRGAGVGRSRGGAGPAAAAVGGTRRQAGVGHRRSLRRHRPIWPASNASSGRPGRKHRGVALAGTDCPEPPELLARW